jgi:hypothetical protein
MKIKIRTVRLLFLGAALIAVVAMVPSCSKKGSSLPPIGGFNSSNDVGKASLLAHWTFDGTNSESISNTAPTSATGASFVTGVKGQALALNNGYVIYPATISALNGASWGSATVSLWINVDNNGTTASSFFALTQPTNLQGDWNQGPLNVYAETGHAAAYDDTLVLHSAFHVWSGGNYSLGGDNINDYGTRGTDFQTVHGTKKWVHYVMRYNGTTSDIDLFADGVLVSNNNFRNRTTGNPPVGIGSFVTNPPSQVILGGWPNSSNGYTNSTPQAWQANLVGSMDELRVWNTALSDGDINSLYLLELAGR